MDTWIAFVADRSAELWARTGEHLVLTGVSTGGAVLLGIPLGVLASKVRSLRGPLTGLIGILQTIPSLAMLAILLALTSRIGVLPAIIALTLYALLPIVRNTLTGIENVPADALEAARGIGMTPRQTLSLVELPLALSTIIAGVRTAAVVGVGIATLSAFIGAGGLGEFINRGLALSSTPLILLGAIPAAILALVVDGSIAGFQWAVRLRPGPSGRYSAAQRIARVTALSAPVLIAATGLYAAGASDGALKRGDADGVVRIASKNFTEQLVLAELLAQVIEDGTDLTVDRRFNLGGTMICHEALVRGEVDVYVEYVGTALTAILGEKGTGTPGEAFRKVRSFYEARFGSTWLRPFGFENTYALAVTEEFSRSNGITTISDLAELRRDVRAGLTSEFVERPDGYPGLRNAYGLSFTSVQDMDPALMYPALASGELDVISAFSTDGRIEAYGLALLKDDRGFFPPYVAAPVVRLDALRHHPRLRRVLLLLSDAIPNESMRHMNYLVDERKMAPREVARRFLADEGFLQDMQ